MESIKVEDVTGGVPVLVIDQDGTIKAQKVAAHNWRLLGSDSLVVSPSGSGVKTFLGLDIEGCQGVWVVVSLAPANGASEGDATVTTLQGQMFDKDTALLYGYQEGGTITLADSQHTLIDAAKTEALVAGRAFGELSLPAKTLDVKVACALNSGPSGNETFRIAVYGIYPFAELDFDNAPLSGLLPWFRPAGGA